MQDILLLSLIYPLPKDNKGTPVCHYFTREWVKMGYNVQVVHIQAVYPKILYWLARLNEKRVAAKTGAIVYTKRLEKNENYVMDGVPVMRLPVYKPIPHGRFSSCSISRAVKVIIDYCREKRFVPDVIVGHFPNPQLEILNLLKAEFKGAKTCLVMHGDEELMKKVYEKRLSDLMGNIDMWGFRSKAILNDFERVIGRVNNPFICYSGIPTEYVTIKNTHEFNTPLKKFVYVGLMIERKYPVKVLEALHKVYPNNDFVLSYVGEGQQVSEIQKKMTLYGIAEQVKLMGRIPRDQILKLYDNADCMVMISRGEAYGLVYLEAMARGCITIASRNEGFDGIIIDGENGFLCEAGNAEELADVIDRINSLTPQQRHGISERAIQTAQKLTDENAAKLYIDEIKSRI